MKFQLLTLFLILPMLLIPILVYGTESFVETDKSEYYLHETIIVSGEVDENIGGTISLVVINPNGHLVSILQLTINEDNTFNTNIIAGGPHMILEGTYKITFNYNDNLIETDFYYYPILFVPEIILQTDQPQYFYGDTVFINGTLLVIEENELIISVISPSEDITYTDEITINEDLTFDMHFDIEGESFDEAGTYTVQAIYGDISASVPFEISSTGVIVTTDQATYYEDSIIDISGIMSEFDLAGDLSLMCDLYYEDGTRIEVWEYADIIREDGTFDLTVNTIDKPRWQYTGGVDLYITIQNQTGSIHFEYINEPDMTNEALYNHIFNIYKILDAIMDDDDDDDDDLQVIINIKEEIAEILK